MLDLTDGEIVNLTEWCNRAMRDRPLEASGCTPRQRLHIKFLRWLRVNGRFTEYPTCYWIRWEQPLPSSFSERGSPSASSPHTAQAG